MQSLRCLPGEARNSRGFTLLEVLLAFVVFALSFAVVLEILGGSMRSSVRAREYTEAALLGQSLMASVGTEIPIEEGALQGEEPGGYRWHLQIAPYQFQRQDERLLELEELTQTTLYWIDLEIAWGELPRERQARFATVRGRTQGAE
jgi:general secretion pathway protein I